MTTTTTTNVVGCETEPLLLHPGLDELAQVDGRVRGMPDGSVAKMHNELDVGGEPTPNEIDEAKRHIHDPQART